jgi:cytochrome-b5 reductase
VARIPDPSNPSGFITRPYTPVSTEDESMKNRYVDFIIKGYENGIVSRYLVNLKPGDVMEMKGPFGKLDFLNIEKMKTKKDIGMIAGGTGITPMLQVLNEILKPDSALADAYKNTRFTLLFANRTPHDILCKDHLDQLVRLHPQRLQVHYIVDRMASGGTSDVVEGRIDKKMIEEKLPASSNPSALVLLCGPEGLLTHFAGPKNPDKSQGPVGGVLKELGYTEEQVYKF